MISVAMATYNSEKYIIKQLNSIYNQSVSIDELIIQDDCSKDDTLKIIEDYKKKNNISNIIIEKNNENLGYIKTFKKAIKRTKGEIIILCDHDDIWLDNKVEIIKDTFEQNENILALATSFIKIDENDKEIKSKNNLFHANNNQIRHRIKKNKLNKMTFKDVAVYNISPGCTCAFNKKLKELFLKKDYNIPHDLNLMILAALKDGLYYLDKVTTKYRIYSNNTIGLGHQTNYDKRVNIVKRGLEEKKEIKKICLDNKCNKNSVKIINKVIYVFKKRACFLLNKKMFNAILALILSINLNKLYESVIMDAITILKEKKN